MAIDPNIALGVRPLELPNQLAQYGQLAQIQSAQNQNQLAQYQLGAAQRAEKTQNMLADAYMQATDQATGKIDYNKLTSLLAAGGGGAQLPGIEKTRRETETAQTAQQKAIVELGDAKLKQSRQFLDTINPTDPNAPAEYLAWHEANHRDPILGPMLAARGVTADQSRARIEQAIQAGPQAFAQLINQSKLGTEKFMEMNKPVTNVGPTGIVQTPGLGGAATIVPGTEAAFQMTPAQKAANEATIRGQNLVDARARERIKIAQAQLNQGELDPAAIDFLATQVNNGDTSVLTGLARSKGAIAAVRNRAVELASATNATPADVTANRAEMVGQLAGQRAVGTQIANVQIAATEANKMIDVAKPYVSKVNPSDYPQVNAIGNYVARNTGDPNIVGLAASLNGLVNTYSRAINPKGVSTVDSRKHAREIINEAMAKGQLDEAFNVMGQEMNAALESGTTTRATMRGQMPGAAKSTEAPKAGSVQNGYRFKGGNPADQSSWEKL